MDIANEFFKQGGVATALFGERQKQGIAGLRRRPKEQRSKFGGIGERESLKGHAFEREGRLKKAVK